MATIDILALKKMFYWYWGDGYSYGHECSQYCCVLTDQLLLKMSGKNCSKLIHFYLETFLSKIQLSELLPSSCSFWYGRVPRNVHSYHVVNFQSILMFL